MAVHPQRLRSADLAQTRNQSGRAEPAARRSPSGRGLPARAKRVLSSLPTVAMLVLTLAVGYAPVRQQSPEAPGWTPVMAGALEAVGSVDDVVLAETVFGLDLLPAGIKDVIFYRLTIPPGETLTALSGPSCSCPGWVVNGGVGAEVVQSGRYRLRVSSPIEVHRHGAKTVETLPAQTEVVLEPGDAAIYPEYTAEAEISVVGEEPVLLVGAAIVAFGGSGKPSPVLPPSVRGETLSQSTASDWEKLASAPIGVSFRRVTLPAGTYVAPYEPIGLEAMRIERGKIERFYFEPGADHPNGQPMIWGEGRVSPFLGFKPGMRYDLASADGEPVELLVLIVEPVGISARTLAP